MTQLIEQQKQETAKYITNFHQSIETRDGMKLSTIVHMLEDRKPRETFLIRTAYSAKGMFGLAKMLAKNLPFQFNYVLQDCRGRYDSEGEFELFNETNDTIDTMNWIAGQDWSNNKVHIFGPSYMGWIALQVLQKESRANIVSIFSPMTFNDLLDNAIYTDGVLNLHHSYPFSIMMGSRVQGPLNYLNTPFPDAYDIALEKGVEHQGYNPKIWNLFMNKERLADQIIKYKADPNFTTKATFVASYFDNICRGSIKAFEEVNAIGGAKPNLIMGPWGHNGYVNSLDSVGKFKITNAQANVSKHLVQHFSNLDPNQQRIQVYVIRKDEWIGSDSWPLTTNPMKIEFSLQNQRQIDTKFDNPVRTMGGPVWDNVLVEGLDPGPYDQRPVNVREDVVRLYSSEFETPVTFAGDTTITLKASVSVPNSHITAKLNIVDKEGVEYIMQDGITIVESANHMGLVEINLDYSAFQVCQGEKLMIELSWSNYPKFARPMHNKDYSIEFDTSFSVSLNLQKYN